MKKQSAMSRFRAWLRDIPIADPVNRQMAALLQVLLLGLISIFLLAMLINIFLSTDPQEAFIQGIEFGIIFTIPLILLRRGYFRISVYYLIAPFLLLVSIGIYASNLRSAAETLTLFTLAILLAGLLLGRTALIITFSISGAIVLFFVIREPDPVLRLDYTAIAGNFILVNGLISIFINYFGITLRTALHSALQREEELKVEIVHRTQAEDQVNTINLQLQQNIAELERFTYTVSHDLRSPLVTIRGFLGMLKSDLQNHPDKVQSDIERIAGATDKMNDLLSDLLELSRIGRVMNQPEEIDTLQLIKDAIESVDARLRSANITLDVQPTFPTIHGDRTRLREVFENLLDNAAKYVGNQEHPLIEIGTRFADGDTLFFIKDNGMGIDTQYHDKIFGLFEKLDSTIEGTGIGLSLAKRIIETHGGSIWVESEGSGKGSTFCFTLPNNTA